MTGCFTAYTILATDAIKLTFLIENYRKTDIGFVRLSWIVLFYKKLEFERAESIFFGVLTEFLSLFDGYFAIVDSKLMISLISFRKCNFYSK